MSGEDQSTSRLDQFFAVSPDLVFVQDREGRFTYVNSAVTNILGFERLYFLGKTWSDLSFPLNLRELLAAEFKLTLTTKQRRYGEIEIPTACETKIYEYVLSPLQRTDGAIDCIILTGREITEQKRAEAALRESEAKYRSLFEAASDLILIVDAATYRILDANWSAVRQLGYTRGELLQLSVHEIEAPLSASCRAAVLQRLETEGSVTYEHIYRRKDATELAVEISTQMIEYGNLLAFQSFARDITERKRAEVEIQSLNAHLEQRVLERTAELSRAYRELANEVAERRKIEAALREQQLFLRNVIDTCPNPIFVKDENGRFVLVNRALANVYETTPEQIQGKTDADFDPDAAEVERFWQSDREVVTTLQPKFIAEETVTAPSGKMHWFQTIKKPLLSPEGQATHVLVVAADITHRKQMETALQASEARYRAIVEDQTELVCRFLADGTLTFVNQAYCQMLGICREELLRHRYKMFLLVLDPQVATQLMVPSTPDHAVTQAECRVILPDGTVRWQQWNNRALFDAAGRLVEYQAVGWDITERKQVEALLKESEERFRVIFERAAVGITQVDLSGRFLQANQWFCDFVGYSEAELLERTVEAITYSTDVAIDSTYARQVLAGRTTNYSIKKRYIHKTGKIKWVNFARSLVHNSEGSPQCFIDVIEDIGDHQLIQKQTRETELYIYNMADTSPMMIWMSDATGGGMFFNWAWLTFTGRSIEQEMDYGWSENVHPEGLKYCLDTYIAALQNGQAFKMSYRLRRADGQYRWILHTGKPRAHAKGNFLGYTNFCVDVDAYQRVRESLNVRKEVFPNPIET